MNNCVYIGHSCTLDSSLAHVIKMVDFYRKGANGFTDQYSDGKAARVWEKYIGGTQRRTDQYRRWIVELLRDNDCHCILDVACGTGSATQQLFPEQGMGHSE